VTPDGQRAIGLGDYDNLKYHNESERTQGTSLG
jgi:hypothetical protein